MVYYHDLITEKSWQILQELKRHHDFILIGGWAVFLFTKSLKSKDIDIICDYKELTNLREKYQMSKNERLKKYEIKIEQIDIDIYAPFFSNLGFPIEEIFKKTIIREGFVLPEKEILLILKQKAFLDRGHTIKGEKDKIDIISLLLSGIDFKKYHENIAGLGLLEYKTRLKETLGQIREVPELDLNRHQFSRFKKKILTALEGI